MIILFLKFDILRSDGDDALLVQQSDCLLEILLAALEHLLNEFGRRMVAHGKTSVVLTHFVEDMCGQALHPYRSDRRERKVNLAVVAHALHVSVDFDTELHGAECLVLVYKSVIEVVDDTAISQFVMGVDEAFTFVPGA